MALERRTGTPLPEYQWGRKPEGVGIRAKKEGRGPSDGFSFLCDILAGMCVRACVRACVCVCVCVCWAVVGDSWGGSAAGDREREQV